ncbi:hypothetical protein HHK36_006137 [Tetracentron sinense]|uniref:Enhancer of polycomb-like protein n=1 Tax=Tetracentron sinense TaxID=13715 RepID=A0A834ZGN3_TETSI|nr:hypothetical protein HHK36_006137 [Tetracentron sinense]
METRVVSSDVSVICKKSRSLDLQSLYVEKSRVSVCKDEPGAKVVVKRKRRPSAENEFILGLTKKRRKSGEVVSLSTLEPICRKSRNSLDAVDGSGLNSGEPSSNKSGLKLSRFDLKQKNQAKKKNAQVPAEGNWQNLSSLSNISRHLDDNLVPIPRRPRGFMRQKTYSNQVLKQAETSRSRRIISLETSSSKVSSVAKTVKLTGDSVSPIISSEVKRKKVFDDFKENRSSRANSARCFKAEDGTSIRYIGNSTSKRVRRNHGKRWEPALQSQERSPGGDPSVDNSARICEDLQQDDDENLEQNAARMLSSRFDPSCTGLCSNGKASASQSINVLSFTSLLGRDFANPGANHSVGSESISADAAGRVLRPRKQHKEKGFIRRRRHFYEIFFRDVNAYWVLNRRIKVFWPLDQSWYFGLVNNYDLETRLHHVKYDDRDEEWINLRNERFKLLLLPSEVPGKSGLEKLGLGDKPEDEEKEDVNVEDDNCIGSYMDSEPIISWLSRSTCRVKSSPFGIMRKQKTSPLKNFMPPMSSEDAANPPQGCFGMGPFRKVTNKLYGNSAVPDRSTAGDMAEKYSKKITTCSKDRGLTFVYFRRRFRKREQGLGCVSGETSGCRSVAGSVTFLASVVDRVGALDKYNIALQSSCAKDLQHFDQERVLWSGENVGLLKLTFPLVKSKLLKLIISFPSHWVLNFTSGVEMLWLYRMLFLLQYGTVMTLWPKVQLEMLFVDSVVGLRFLLFEGCLMQAVAFVCLILIAFHLPNEYGKFVDLQLPVTSIRFKLSGFQDLAKQLVFVFYNFLEVKNSKWLYLDCKFERHCLFTKQLPLSECTYDNIKVLQSGSDQLPVAAVPISLQGSRKQSRKDMHVGISKELASIDMSCSSSNSNENHRGLPPFVLPFTAAPTFFLSLHLKLLLDQDVASIKFQNHNAVSLLEGPPESRDILMGDCSLVEDFSNQVSGITLENNMGGSLRAAVGSGFSPCAKSKVETDALSICNDGDWINSSKNCLNSELNVTGTSVGPQDSGKNEINGIIRLRRHPCHLSGLEQYLGRSWPSVPEDHYESEVGCNTGLNGINVEIPPFNQVKRQPVYSKTHSSHQSKMDFAWNVNDYLICSPNPTAPRSIWHRNRHSSGSSSFDDHSKMWPEGKTDFIHPGFGNGSRKPRTEVSYLLPFGGYDCGSKPRSHHWKGRPYKRIRIDNEKKASDCSKSPQRHLEELTCDVNVLITAGDRGRREYGALVVLEFVDHKDWRLLVNFLGTTKYSHKAHQFMQPGTTNRYTHAMMWRGGKEWILEFRDRSQWTLFKAMHEECYNRNIRAATVKNIPIPGVHLIEEGDDNATKVPFVHSSPKYFLQVETEVDMAMDSYRVLYDMDSDDEEWISKHRIFSDVNGSYQPEISEEMFERTMDMFEKVSYAQQREDFTYDEIEELMVGLGPIEIIKAIYDRWQQKRQRKGMPLIRQFLPPLWEMYQQQVKEWELAIIKTNTILYNGCKEKAALIEKPALFAFCLKPRGLEVPNKGSKQKSQKKVLVGGHNYVISGDQGGAKLNGFDLGEERVVNHGHNHQPSDSSPWLQMSTMESSPRDAISPGYLSIGSDGSGKNQHPKFYRNKSKKMRMFLPTSESQMMMKSNNQRTIGKSKRYGVFQWDMGPPEWPSQKQYQPEGSQRHKIEQLSGSGFDEFRLRDASGAAQHASNIAKLMWEKAQRLLYRADLAIHKAVVSLMTAEAIKASSSDSIDDG